MNVNFSLAHVVGLVLAGGLSRRMNGREKAFLPFGEDVLLTHILKRFIPQVSSMLLSANGDAARFARFDLPVIADRRSGTPGPLAGIEAAFWASGAEWMVSVPVDVPFLPLDLVSCLGASANKSGLTTVAKSDGRIHPVICLWSRSALPLIQSALDADNRRMMALFKTLPHETVEFAPDSRGVDPFFNINQPDLLTEASRLARDGPLT
ncbi:MAG: molybdenum cofactor guanylyltransferase [Magnetococcus sp. YQC-5]